MKLTTFILIATMLHVSAAGFGQKITLKAQNVSLENVFQQIRKQTGVDFFFDAAVLKSAGRVTVNVENANLEEVLKSTFAGQNLNYVINDKSVVISRKVPSFLDRVASAFARIDVRGRVLDENGQPLPGATVRLKGGTISAMTKNDGTFFLPNVDENSVLTITYLGYKVKEVPASTDIMTIRLEVQSSELDNVEIVNTGYQVLPKERSAGSFAKPDMAILANRSGSMSIIQRLDGLVAGLTINNSPGGRLNPVLLRGLTTIGTEIIAGGFSGTPRAPLYVVDGIATDDTNINSINPQDVEDITVLKDASAASIWGARAANGVIVITTKKGTKNEKVKIQYDGFVNFLGKPDLNYLPVLNSQQFIQAAEEIFDPVRYPYSPTFDYAPHDILLYGLQSNPTGARRGLDSLAAIDNKGQIRDIWYRNGMLSNQTISLSGGGQKYSFYGSGSYTSNRSNRPGEKNETYKINLRQDFSIGSRVKFNLISDVTNNVTKNPRNITVDNRFYPYQLFRDANGNNISMPYMTSLSESSRIDYQTRSRIDLNYNPLDEVDYGYTKADMFLSRNILGANIKLIDGLSFNGTYGFVKGNTKTDTYDDSKSYGLRREVVRFTVAPTAASVPVYNLPTTGGTLQIVNANQRNWTIRNQLNYDKNWVNGLHQLNILLGQEAQESLATTNTSKVRGYNDLLQNYTVLNYALLNAGIPNTVWPNNGTSSILNEGYFGINSGTPVRFTSYYANGAYTFHSKYTINSSFRVDKSNLFGLDKSAQNKPSWSTGVKWLISEESFLKNVNWLNNLAVRTTYGIGGMAPSPGTAASFDLISPTSSVFLPDNTGLTISTPANRRLSWESTSTLNLGIDFSVLTRRINGSVDYYQRKTTDMLGQVPTNGFTGYANVLGNIGNMKNDGFELSLNSTNIVTNNFRWTSLFNLAYNKNVITSLTNRVPVTTGNGRVTEQYVAGYAAYAVFAYEYAGLDNVNGDPQIRLADGTVTKLPNAAKLEDMKFKGTSQPVWSGGLSNTFSYKNLSLSANMIFNLGHVMRRDVNDVYSGGRFTHFSLSEGFASGNVHADFANRWKNPGDELITNIPSYEGNTSLNASRRYLPYYTFADINVISASYIKLRDISLIYALPRNLLSKAKVDQITLRAQVSNLMLWKANDDGIDPEFHLANGPNGGYRMLPSNQGTITFGLNVKF